MPSARSPFSLAAFAGSAAALCTAAALAAPLILQSDTQRHLLVDAILIQSSTDAFSDLAQTDFLGGAALTWTQTDSRGVSTPHYAFRNDALPVQIAWSRPLPFDPAPLALRWATFDPLRAAPVIPTIPTIPDFLAAAPHNRTFIVQFIIPPIDSMRQSLLDLGASIHTSLPHSAYIITIDPARLADIRALPAVRWVGDFEPAYKTEPAIARGYLSAFGASDPAVRADFARNWAPFYVQEMEKLSAGGTASFWIQVHEAGLPMKQIVADRITALGGVVQNITPSDHLMRAELNQAQLVEVLKLDQVAFVDPWSPAGTDMDIERNLSGANALEAATGFSGEGVKGELIDSGLRQTHLDFVTPAPAPVIRLNNGDNSHGTSTFGIIFSDGGSNAAGRGLLPDAAAKYFYSYYGLSGFGGSADRLAITNVSVNTNNVVIQSNSWGSALTTAYGTQSNAMDNIIWQTGLVICQSQSNAGSTQSRPEAWAKNVVAVGAVTHNNDTNRANDTWGGGSSIGPASDQRIKPELAHHYDMVLATTSTSNTAYTPTFGGTSAATPITCGYMGLIHQMWHEGTFPGHGGAADVFASRPSFTTARALAIHSAHRYNWTGTPPINASINRNVQGWGVMNVERLRTLAPVMFVEDQAKSLIAGQSALYTFDVPAGSPAFAATMVFRDPPGTTSAAIHRINDASLKVTGPSGTFWWGNNGLTTGNVSAVGGVSNTRDQVENVFLVNPPAGRYQVRVFADIVTQDGNPRTVGVNDVTYSLAVSGGARTPVRILTLDAARAGSCGDGTSKGFGDSAAFAQVREWLADPRRFGGAGRFDRPIVLQPSVAAFTPAALANTDVVILTGAASELSPCERARLGSFISQGGGLIAMYDNAGADFESALDCDAGSPGVATEFVPAAATGPVLNGPFGTVNASVSGGTHNPFASVGPRGVGLLSSDTQSVAALFTLDLGRAVIINDEEWATSLAVPGCLTGSLPLLSNERFFLNSLAAVAPAVPVAFTFSNCPADLNCDGEATFIDYLDFVDALSLGAAAADFNTDGVVDFFDYLDFVQTFSAGC